MKVIITGVLPSFEEGRGWEVDGEAVIYVYEEIQTHLPPCEALRIGWLRFCLFCSCMF